MRAGGRDGDVGSRCCDTVVVADMILDELRWCVKSVLSDGSIVEMASDAAVSVSSPLSVCVYGFPAVIIVSTD